MGRKPKTSTAQDDSQESHPRSKTRIDGSVIRNSLKTIDWKKSFPGFLEVLKRQGTIDEDAEDFVFRKTRGFTDYASISTNNFLNILFQSAYKVARQRTKSVTVKIETADLIRAAKNMPKVFYFSDEAVDRLSIEAMNRMDNIEVRRKSREVEEVEGTEKTKKKTHAKKANSQTTSPASDDDALS